MWSTFEEVLHFSSLDKTKYRLKFIIVFLLCSKSCFYSCQPIFRIRSKVYFVSFTCSPVYLFICFFISNMFICRQTPGNGTLYFPPFLGQYHRPDVHEGVYRCRASNQVGTILSRDVQIRAGTNNMYPIRCICVND